MGNEANKKFTWVIKNYSNSQRKIISSDIFVIGGCKWRLVSYPKGKDTGNLPLLISVANFDNLPSGWRRHTKCRITIVNQFRERLSELQESQIWFDKKDPALGYKSKIPLSKFYEKDGGFLVNGELKIVVEIEILEVIGNVDVVEEYEEPTQPLKKIRLCNDFRMENSSGNESIDVNGFQVLPSQVDFVRLMFEKHPDIALEFNIKNPILKTAYMNVLLSVTDTLHKSLQEISKDDLADAYGSLGSMRAAGFKVDWLERKLNEMSEKKEKEEACETRMQEIEQEMTNMKAKMLDARVPLTWDDVF